MAALLGLGITACGPRRDQRLAPAPNGPQRVGSVPMTPVGGVSGTKTPLDPPGGAGLSLSEWRGRLAAARQTQLRRLREYAERRVFPIYRGADRTPHIRHRELTDKEPVFVDHRGVHCAVGYLMDQSGWSEAVDGIVRADNNVYVEEVDDGPLIRWIEVSGLTQQEAAFIQPSYGWEKPPRPRPQPPVQPDPIPPPPPSNDHLAAEIARLVEHFANVDEQLREDSDISIDEALHRLEPRIKAGLPIGSLS